MPRLVAWIESNLWAIIIAVVSVIYAYATVNSRTESRLATIEAQQVQQARLLTCIHLSLVQLQDGKTGGDPCRIGG